jgi:glycosyltransferase involved in cell wall biosynthesis
VHLAVYTDAAERGGAESMLGNLLERLDPSWRVSVVGPDEAVVRWLAGRRRGSAPVVVDRIEGRSDVANMIRHRRVIRSLDPDVLHANLSTMSSCQWALAVAATVPGLPVVVLEHAPMGTWSASSTWLKRLTSSRAAAHVAVGEVPARTIERLGGLPAGSIRVIHSGVPQLELDPPPRPDDVFTVGILSRLDPVKGVDRAVRAVAGLDRPARLVVVGDGPERAVIEDIVQQLGLDDVVELRGWDDRARHLLPTFDAYLLPSRLEAFPVTIGEAALAGVPVVATDVGSVREAVVDGVTGLVVPQVESEERTVAALTEALLSLQRDPARRADMGRAAALDAVERFDVDRSVAEWEDLYRSVARRR